MLVPLSVSLVALFTEYAHAQARFTRLYKDSVITYTPYSVRQTSDGGYIVAGYTGSSSDYDIFLIKTDADGYIQWAKTYGGTDYDLAYSVQQTSDGGYIVAGYTRSFGVGSSRPFLIKTDADGNVQWAKVYGGGTIAYSVQQTSDGGYIVAGSNLLIKTDANGDVQWAKAYPGLFALSVQQTSDGGYILAGYTGSSSDYNILLIKTDASGNVQWAKTYGGTGDDVAYSVQQTSDGGYIVAGYTRSFGVGSYDIFLIKTDANGNLQWAKTYGGASWEYAYSVQQTSGGGYIVAGYTESFGAGSYDIFLIKTDANGNLQWAKTYGGAGGDWALSVQQTSDGGYIVAGSTTSFGLGSNIFLIKTDANGNIGSCPIVSSAIPIIGLPSPTVNTPSPSVSSPSITVNSVSPTVTSRALMTFIPCPTTISESCKPVSGLITPYKGGIKVSRSGEFEVKVYNVSGVMVKSIKGKDEVKLELSRGVYFVEVVSGGKVIREKVVIR